MGAPPSGVIARRAGVVPGLATALVLGAALLAWLVPGLGDALVLDRDAVRAGDLWRIATGSLVHLSAEHLAYNLFAVGVAGWLLESRGRRLATLLFVSSIAVSGGVLLFAPHLQRYGGLSGVAYALVVMLALDAVRSTGRWRRLGVVTLVATAAKLAWELGAGQYVLVDTATAAFVPVPISHVAGAAVAVVAWCAEFARGREKWCRPLGVAGRETPDQTPLFRAERAHE